MFTNKACFLHLKSFYSYPWAINCCWPEKLCGEGSQNIHLSLVLFSSLVQTFLSSSSKSFPQDSINFMLDKSTLNLFIFFQSMNCSDCTGSALASEKQAMPETKTLALLWFSLPCFQGSAKATEPTEPQSMSCRLPLLWQLHAHLLSLLLSAHICFQKKLPSCKFLQ